MKKFNFLFYMSLIIMLTNCWYQTPEDPEDPRVNPATPPKEITITGYAQKGPLLESTSVRIYELDDNLVRTSLEYETEIEDDYGMFKHTGKFLHEYAEVEVKNAYYFNEVTGSLDGPITLRSVARLTQNCTISVNVLTTIARDRIFYLVKQDSQILDNAKSQAEIEVLDIFNIKLTDINNFNGFEQMNMTKSGESNGVLLAVSSIVQKNHSRAEVTELISKLAGDIEEDGEIEQSSIYKSEIISSSMNLDASAISSFIKSRYEYLNIPIEIPDFLPFIDSDGDGNINKNENSMTLNNVEVDCLSIKQTLKRRFA